MCECNKSKVIQVMSCQSKYKNFVRMAAGGEEVVGWLGWLGAVKQYWLKRVDEVRKWQIDSQFLFSDMFCCSSFLLPFFTTIQLAWCLLNEGFWVKVGCSVGSESPKKWHPDWRGKWCSACCLPSFCRHFWFFFVFITIIVIIRGLKEEEMIREKLRERI